MICTLDFQIKVGWALVAHASVPTVAEGSLKGDVGYCPCCSCRCLRTVSLLWGVVLFVGENTMPNNYGSYGSLVYNHNYYGAEEMAAEADRLRLMLGHKDEIIAQKDKELAALQEIIALLKARQD